MLNLVKSFYNYKHSHGERMFTASTHVKVVSGYKAVIIEC